MDNLLEEEDLLDDKDEFVPYPLTPQELPFLCPARPGSAVEQAFWILSRNPSNGSCTFKCKSCGDVKKNTSSTRAKGHICPAATIDRKWTACQTPHAEYVKLFKADAVKEGLKRKLDAGDNKQQKTENKAKSFDSSVTSKLSNKSKKDQIRMDCTLCRAELLNPIYTNNEQLGLLSSCIDVNCPLKVHQHPPVVPVKSEAVHHVNSAGIMTEQLIVKVTVTNIETGASILVPVLIDSGCDLAALLLVPGDITQLQIKASGTHDAMLGDGSTWTLTHYENIRLIVNFDDGSVVTTDSLSPAVITSPSLLSTSIASWGAGHHNPHYSPEEDNSTQSHRPLSAQPAVLSENTRILGYEALRRLGLKQDYVSNTLQKLKRNG